jgi:hypothetical protein
MKNNALLALALVMVPGLASAEITVSGGVTLTYGKLDGGFGTSDVKEKGVDGRMKLDFGNGILFGLQVGKIDMPISDTPISLEGEFVALDAAYRFTNGMRVGAYADRLTMGIDLSPIDLTLKTSGVSVGYEGQGFDAEAFIGNTSISPAVLPFDIENRGVTVSYTGQPGLEAGATWLRAELSAGGFSENIDFKGVAASYTIGESMIVFGGLSKADFFLGGSDLDSLGLGLGYDLGAAAGFSATVSLEVAKTDLGDTSDIDTLRLGLTVPFGAKGPSLPMNSVADSILNPRHGAFNAALTSAF